MSKKPSLLPLYAFNFLKNLQFFGALAVPFYLYRVGLNYVQMFTLEAIFSFFVFVLEIPTGVVADRFGRKLSLMLGALTFGAAFLVFSVTHSYPILIGAEILCAVGMTLMSGADRALLYESLKETGMEPEAGKINARYDAAGTAGMFLAFPLGTLFAGSGLVSYDSALGLVFAATGVSIIFSGLTLFFVRETSRVRTHGSALRAGVDGFRFIFKKPALTSFSLNYAIVSALTFFMFWFYQSLLMKNDFPVSFQGFIPAGFNLGAMLLLLATGVIQNKIGTKTALFLSSLIPGLLYLGVFFVPGLPMALTAIFGVTMLKMFRAPMLATLMNTHIEDSNRATVLSGVSMMERILTTAFYPLAGLLTDISLEWTFLAMGSVTVLVSLLFRVDERHFGQTERNRSM